MRVLPQVEEASFDIPSEIFTIELRVGADSTAVLEAIEKLGFKSEVLLAPPSASTTLTNLRQPTSDVLRAGFARATKRGVPLLVAFGGPFCPLCRRFKETTLRDTQVIARLAALEVIHVDIEGDPASAKDLDVHAVPDLWVLDGSGRVLARHNGYLDADKFLAFLDRATKR